MEPTTPALHWAITNLGVLKMNIGEAMTGISTHQKQQEVWTCIALSKIKHLKAQGV
jgi:hypothetical protein